MTLRRDFTVEGYRGESETVLEFMGAEKMRRRTVRSLSTTMLLIRRSASLWPLALLIAAAIPAPAHAGLVYLVGQTGNTSGGLLESYDTVSQQVTTLGSTNLGSTNVLLNDIAENTAGTLYAVDFPTSTTSNLYSLTTSGALTQISSQNFALNALVFDISGTLWAAGGNQVYYMTAGSNSFTTMSSTISTSTNGLANYLSSGDLAFVGSTLYLTELDGSGTDILVQINTTTGVGTKVGSIKVNGTGLSNVNSLATIDNTLYAFSGNSAYTIDVASGAATLISGVDLGFGANGEVHGAAANPQAAVPEPSSIVMTGFGVLACFGYARGRRRRGIVSI
jgi:hypothetical protein